MAKPGGAPRNWNARRICLVALRQAGVPQSVIAEAFCYTPSAIQQFYARLGLTRAPQQEAADHREGETWVDLPEHRLRVSSLGRVVSMRTGLLVKVRRYRNGGRDFVRIRRDRQSVEVRVDLLMSKAFGLPMAPRSAGWDVADTAALLSCATLSAAADALPHRTLRAISKKASKLGHTFRREPRPPKPKELKVREPASPIRGSVPYFDPIWAEANGVVPRGLPPHVRDDLISEMVLLRLEGRMDDMRVLLKEAIRERNRMTGAYKERSLDSPVRGSDSLRLIDTLADDVEHL